MKDLLRKLFNAMHLMRAPFLRKALLIHRVAATTEHESVLRKGPIATVVDIGANRGQFSLAARHHHPDAQIVAFEPLPTAAAVYRKVFVNDRRTMLHVAAVSPADGEATMQISRREDSSSLLPISQLQTALYPEVVAIGTAKVPTAPLDRFLSVDDIAAPALLKIDVQGFELEVLKASVGLLPRFARVYVEASFVTLYEGQALAYQVVDFLREQHFLLTGIYNPAYHPRSGDMLQADLLFTREISD